MMQVAVLGRNSTSALGPMLEATLASLIIATAFGLPGTGSSYGVNRPLKRTAASPAGRIEPAATETVGAAVMEIRRRSGLTWEELGDLFGVSRRSVHHWASGKTVSPRHDQLV